MVVRISGSAGISFNDEPFATEPFVTSALEDIPVFQKKIAAFTGDGVWTVPAGVTYAIAHMLGGGGGGGSQTGTNATNGGASSVAFASGTVTAEGGRRAVASTGNSSTGRALDPPANSGRGGGGNGGGGDGNTGNGFTISADTGLNSTWIVAGAEVTPASSITVTVGAGGAKATGGAQGSDGAAGYVYIEYYEEI